MFLLLVVTLDAHTDECWLLSPFASFPFTSPTVLRRVPLDSVSALQPHRTKGTFPLSSNRYNPLCNVLEVEDTLVSTGNSRMAESKQVREHKLDRKRMVCKKQHKVIILGHSHARGCASEVSRLLNNDFDLLGFVNPGAGMKYIKDTSRVKFQQLTKRDVLVLWGGAL